MPATFCDHDIAAIDAAVGTEGKCPICLSQKLDRANSILRELANWFDLREDSLRAIINENAFYDLQGLRDRARGVLG